MVSNPERRDFLEYLNIVLSQSTNPENAGEAVAKEKCLAHVRDIPSARVYMNPGSPEMGELILDLGDMGPRFTHFEDPSYRQ